MSAEQDYAREAYAAAVRWWNGEVRRAAEILVEEYSPNDSEEAEGALHELCDNWFFGRLGANLALVACSAEADDELEVYEIDPDCGSEAAAAIRFSFDVRQWVENNIDANWFDRDEEAE